MTVTCEKKHDSVLFGFLAFAHQHLLILCINKHLSKRLVKTQEKAFAHFINIQPIILFRLLPTLAE